MWEIFRHHPEEAENNVSASETAEKSKVAEIRPKPEAEKLSAKEIELQSQIDAVNQEIREYRRQGNTALIGLAEAKLHKLHALLERAGEQRVQEQIESPEKHAA